MRVLVLGGSGRTGRHLLAALTRAGHSPVLLGRRAPEGWVGEVRLGDPGDPDAVAGALAGVDAAMSCLGSTRGGPVCLRATRAVIAAAPRDLPYLVVGGAAVDAPGDAKGLGDRAVGALMRLVAGAMLAERQAEHDALRASALAWTFLRPPRLTDGPGTGRWAFTDDRPAAMRIDRADLARAMLEAAGRSDMGRRAPFVAGLPA